MKLVTYNGPSDQLQLGDQVVPRGSSIEVSNEVAAQLERDPSMSLEVQDAPEQETRPARRADSSADAGEKE